MTELPQWRENPPSPERRYDGCTWLTLNGKEIACMGIGPDVRAAMLELAGREKCETVRNNA